jgi:cytochrome c553
MDVRLIAAALASACISAAAYGQVAVKGDPAKAQQIVTSVCAACHGADGNSAIPANPSIAGQPAEYVYKQLNNFKSAGGKPAERPSPVMTAMVANLSADDMANLAARGIGRALWNENATVRIAADCYPRSTFSIDVTRNTPLARAMRSLPTLKYTLANAMREPTFWMSIDVSTQSPAFALPAKSTLRLAVTMLVGVLVEVASP